MFHFISFVLILHQNKKTKSFGIISPPENNKLCPKINRKPHSCPFEIRADTAETAQMSALDAFEALRGFAEESGQKPMTLDEINAEIKSVRNDRKKKNLRGN